MVPASQKVRKTLTTAWTTIKTEKYLLTGTGWSRDTLNLVDGDGLTNAMQQEPLTLWVRITKMMNGWTNDGYQKCKMAQSARVQQGDEAASDPISDIDDNVGRCPTCKTFKDRTHIWHCPLAEMSKQGHIPGHLGI